MAADQLQFRGVVEWLTPEQGGRHTGPPRTSIEHDYAANAFVPPETPYTGLASFVLRVHDRGAWRSEAQGQWLIVPNAGPHLVTAGTVVAISEGPKHVADFHVHEVTSLDRH